ncbi:MAG: 3-deoxy-manno-octulosonate cytidylyltransferase [Desulfobacteraceae bacterium]
MNIAIIPSRFGSKRFPGKPLALISGKPLIQRACEQAAKAGNISRVVVATDESRIFDVVEGFGGEAVMTASHHRSGTDRVAEAAGILNIAPEEVVINIQGDQPLFPFQCLDDLLTPFENDPELSMATLAVPMKGREEIENPGNVKVVFDTNNMALYFSRSFIPFPRDTGRNTICCHKHLGFYAYKKHFLDMVTKLPDSKLENIEKLEQLRVLEHGYRIKVVVTGHTSLSVDRPEDITAVEKLIKE